MSALELMDGGAGFCYAFYGLEQSVMACISLSAGVMVGLVIVLCWNITVLLSCSLLVDLMWHLFV